MKIKCRPEDFRVQELIRLKLKKDGAYSIYRLEKRFWNTLDVLRQVQLRYGLKGLSRAGLKDRYSSSVQFFSLPGKGPAVINAPNWSLTCIGMADEPVTPASLIGNRFEITLRSLDTNELTLITHALPLIRHDGVPNYYDDQRFGSARHKAGFIARKLIQGHYNGALKLFLATPGSGDDQKNRKRKKELAANWGNWTKCLKIAPFEARPALLYLNSHPKDFPGAVQLLPKTLLELFIVAYQSWLWNQTLARFLDLLGLATLKIRYTLGEMFFYERLTPEQHQYLTHLTIPALGPKTRFVDDRVARSARTVLNDEGLDLNRLKLKFRIKNIFFKPYDRSATFKPEQLNITNPEPDELYPEKTKLRISFILPPGSYATLLIKRLLARPQPEPTFNDSC